LGRSEDPNADHWSILFYLKTVSLTELRIRSNADAQRSTKFRERSFNI
jgi:hypothetical protein